MDVKNGEPIPRKSILKSRSRESSVCSDTSESSAADFEERRTFGRTLSHDENTYSDTSDGITEEDSPTGVLLHPTSSFQVNSAGPDSILRQYSNTVKIFNSMPTTLFVPLGKFLLQQQQCFRHIQQNGTDTINRQET